VSLRNIEFVIQEALVGIWRNGVMAIAEVSTVALSLSILGAFILLSLATRNFVEQELKKFEVGVYLEPQASRAQALDLGKKIRRIKEVREVVFIPKEKAWPQFKKSMTSKLDLGGVEANPLPDAYRVKVKSPRAVEQVAQVIRGMENVERVREGRQELRHVLALEQFVRYVGGLAAVALFVTCVFIISNAIRLTVFARRREIRIMQLVGATDWFIRAPLVVEGMLLGAVGAVISFGIISLGSNYLAEVAARMMPLLRQVSSGLDRGQFAWGISLAGALVGALGSMLSIRRFL